MPKKIGIICAMKRELDLLEGLSGNLVCALSGIGKVNAAVTAERMIADEKPDCIISLGVAGTFVEGINEGDFVIASRTAFHDVWCGKGNAPGQVQGLPLFFESDHTLLKAAVDAIRTAKVGLVCSGDQFYISREEDNRQKKLFPDALAIDMEAAAVAQVCFLHGIPFLAVKIISDNHLHPSQAERYDSFWDTLAEKSFRAVEDILAKINETL
ncbi:MAG: 5'-methylthioadenosine/S-adenosylhomocysteine nucleosidase [Bacteroidales bacterium]|nr:5'-methylthioadenosine/S-adenosylhomocysteine nucleosidase [Bacteroidales bacterium]